ncbi:hypothetical protein [Streptomyces sp. NPDC058084]|uniref:hypothetical protein n=1 Tax=Streptomyces sp. NPDC058084 TaxID=3346333 RepID=UPI0036E11826
MVGVVDAWVSVVAGIYVVVVSATVMVCFWLAEKREWRALAESAGPGRPSTQGLSLYELAFIENRFGPGNILGVAVVRMHAEHRLTLLGREFDGFRFRVDDPDPRDEVEAALLDLLARKRGWLSLSLGPYDLSLPPWQALHQHLVADGLLRERGLPRGVSADSQQVSSWKRARARAYRIRFHLLAWSLTAGAGTALLSGAWLLLALYVAALSILPVLSRPAVRPQATTVTEEGKAAARAARTQTPDSKQAQALLAVALGGLTAIPPWHPFAKPPPSPQPPPPTEHAGRNEEPTRIMNLDPPGLGGL